MASTIHSVAHGLTAGDTFYFGNVFPTTAGVVEGQVYYVLASGLTADAFQFSETDGGAAFTLTEAITEGIVSQTAVYTPITDPADVMAPPETPTAPGDGSLASDVQDLIVRMTFTLDGSAPSSPIRLFEVQVTREFSGTPNWDASITHTLPPTAGSITFPVLPLTEYYARIRSQDVYGQFSDWSNFISETSVDGADSYHMSNKVATVYSDEDGLHVLDGAVFIQDEFGSSVLGASGAVGAWEDHALTGIKNGSFASNAADITVVGRIASIPYWTAAASGGATIDAQVGAVKFNVNAIGESATLTSDPIRVRGGSRYYIAINNHSAYTGGGALDRTITVRKYQADGTLGGTLVLDVENYVTGDNELAITNQFVATLYGTNGEDPTDYITIEVKVNNKTGTISGSGGFLVYEVALVPWAEQFFNTSQPTAPAHGDLWQAPNNGEWYEYDDGTGEWTSVLAHQFIIPLNVTTTIPLTATATARFMATNPEPTYDIQIISLQAACFVASGGSALSGSHKWVGSVFSSPSSTSLGTLDIDSGSSNVHRRIATSSAAVIPASDPRITVTWTKTGTPGDLTPAAVVVMYRKTLTT